MSLESVTRIHELTGLDRRTIKARLDLAGLVPVIEGRSHLFETRDALLVLYSAADGVEYDLTAERARLAHHQANNEALKEQAARGEMVPATMVIKYGAAMVAAARAKFLAVASKIRARNSDLSEKTIGDIDAMIKEALDELANDGIPSEVRAYIQDFIRRLANATDPDN